MVGQVLAQRRLRLGLTIEEVARLARLTAADVARVESDGPGLTMATLGALGVALAFDPAALLRGEALPDPRRLPAWFRSHTGEAAEAISGHDARLFAVAEEVGRIGAFLGDLLGRPVARVAESLGDARPHEPEEPWRTGYRQGGYARERLELTDPTTPADRPIVSLQSVLERLGIHVAHVVFQGLTKYAVSIARPGAMPIVLLNVALDRASQPLPRRAVLAHELCHLAQDCGETAIPASHVQPTSHALEVEQRANAFAPAFIAPPVAVRAMARAMTGRQAVHAIATTWGLGAEGAIWHAKNCERIDAAEADELHSDTAFRSEVYRATASAAKWEPELFRSDPRNEGLEVDTTSLVGGLVQELVLQAVRCGAISAGRAREILTLS